MVKLATQVFVSEYITIVFYFRIAKTTSHELITKTLPAMHMPLSKTSNPPNKAIEPTPMLGSEQPSTGVAHL